MTGKNCKYQITTLGCKVNQCESEALAHHLSQSGWNSSQADDQVNVCIINTCTVTQKASMQSRQAIRQAVRANPDALIIVTGCYAQTEPDAIRKIQGVDYIIGNSDKHNIPRILSGSLEAPASATCQCHDISTERRFQPLPDISIGTRTRPFLKIQDGCNNFCTYCIVPFARGRSRSMPPEDVLSQIRKLKQSGYREVVLTGIHLGCYGLDLSPDTSLLSLIRRIEESGCIDRVRLSSIEPHELSPDIIRLVSVSEMFCRHFHIPLQSGDDRILKRMHRPYTRSFFKNLVFQIHELMPDAAIGVDTLIGFPGENPEAFENTYSLIQELPVSYLHVFPFSSRKNTPAARFPDKVPPGEIKNRCRLMRELGNRKKTRFLENLVGTQTRILVEEKTDTKTGLMKGMSSNYIPVLFTGEDHFKNKIITVRLDRITKNSQVFGSRIDPRM
ncbi:MAG: tRNA (N(6)-L-threonylcarbamoyladenosine(37)-C(2))-methylthiotransferase MtaB [Desulfobacterales bacterium]|nr:tRNA (N(6)-L-threonylcarbamoyladenosine(37)-C(2))-methylthiotransferase MtaB [Desulfobacterales bacterium]MDD4392578.1 tRNA (N(6)-L-threonylcarbamoyladenosine(37)-C(2))-methylthiotransferase MtaB [Desulfobacterales bacterium]